LEFNGTFSTVRLYQHPGSLSIVQPWRLSPFGHITESQTKQMLRS